MNPLDPRDPKNLVAYQIFFGDDEKRDGPSRSPGNGGCGSLGCAPLLFGMLLFAVAAAMWR